MTRLLLTCLTALLLSLPMVMEGAELKSSHSFGFAVDWYCDGLLREAYWTNIWGGNIYVRKAQVEYGSDGGQVSDIFYWWWIDNGIQNDGSRTLSQSLRDHYTNYTGEHGKQEPIPAGTYMLIRPNDRMVFQYRCTLFSGSSATTLMPVMWYTDTP